MIICSFKGNFNSLPPVFTELDRSGRMCAHMKPHSIAAIGWVPAPAPVLLCPAVSAAWTARGAEELPWEPTDALPPRPFAPRPPPLSVAAGCAPMCCLMHLEELPASSTGQLPPLAWEMMVCTEPGKQGGVEVSHLQELVHSFVTRPKVHMAFTNWELLFLALVPTISPVLETLLAGTARITSITAKHEKSCKKFIILPM